LCLVSKNCISTKYKATVVGEAYFITITTVGWVAVFTRLKPEFFNFGGKYTFDCKEEGAVFSIHLNTNSKYIKNFCDTKVSVY
jgi:hypothetical protein